MTPARTICLGFLSVILLGTLLLMLPIATQSGQWGAPVIALFTSTSAVCVTGLSVVDIGTYFSPWGQACILLLFQIGGLGYMTSMTVLVLLLGRRFRLKDKLAIQQALDQSGLGGVRQLLLSILLTTAIFELTGTFFLLPAFASNYGWSHGLWLALFHSVSAFNNAGFSLFKDSLMGYVGSPLVIGTISVLIIAGGIGYQVLIEAYLWGRDWIQKRAERTRFCLNTRVVVSTTLVLLALGTVGFWAIEVNNPQTFGQLDWSSRLLGAWFQSVTTRTAGFNSIDVGQMSATALFICIALMFIGGSPGGTAGGIKTTTLRVLVRATRAILRGQQEIILYERQIPVTLVYKAIAVFIGSLGAMIVATTLLSLTDPEFTFIQIWFEVVSAFATVGLSMGITTAISPLGKLVLIGTMYTGRVGVLLLMSALVGDPKPTRTHYPEETFLVG